MSKKQSLRKQAPIVKISPHTVFNHVERHDDLPVTRREFIARGMMAGGASIMMPSMFALATAQQAFGQTNACSGLTLPAHLNDVAVLVVDGAGGFLGASMAMPPAADGNPFFNGATTATLGWSSEDTIDATTVRGLNLRVRDGFRTGLMTPVTDARYNAADLGVMLSMTSGFTHSCQTNNDTNVQRMNPAALIAAVQEGVFLRQMIGRKSSDVLNANGATFTEIRVDNVQALQRSVSFANAAFQDKALVEKWSRAVSRLSESQAVDLGKRAFGRQLASLLGGNVLQNQKFGDPCYPDLMNPASVASVSAAFTIGANNNTTELSIYNALSNLYAPVGTITVGGSDYHDGGNTTAQNNHTRLGQIAQRFLMTCFRNFQAGMPTAASKAMVLFITDGGVRFDSAVGRQPNAINDRGEAGGSFAIMADFSNGSRMMRSLNYLTSAEAASSSEETGKRPECIAISGAATYAAFGRHGLNGRTIEAISGASGLNAGQIAKHNAVRS